MELETKTPSTEVLQRTIDACAWLIDIAQYSVDHFGWSPEIVQYLDALGSGSHAALQGGMGVVTPMKRSVTDVEMCADSVDCRGQFVTEMLAVEARHAKQINDGRELMQ